MSTPRDLVPLPLLRAAAISACILLVGAMLWLVVLVLGYLMTVTVAVVAGVLLAALVEPLTDLLKSRLRAPDWLAALVTVVATLAAIIGVVVLLVGRARGELDDLRGAVADGIDGLRDRLLDSPLPLSEARLDEGEEQLTDAVVSALPSPATGAGVATEILTGAALAVLLWFFVLKDGPQMWAWVRSWVPARHHDTADRAGRTTWQVLTSYIRGTTAVAAVDAVGVGIGMVILGVPLWASLSLLVFLGAYVPIVGSTIAGGIAVLVALVTLGPVPALILVGIVLLVQQIEGNLLQPLIMGRALDLHPVAIVFTVAVGVLWAGVLGAVVSVPLVALVLRLSEGYRSDPRSQKDQEAASSANA